MQLKLAIFEFLILDGTLFNCIYLIKTAVDANFEAARSSRLTYFLHSDNEPNLEFDLLVNCINFSYIGAQVLLYSWSLLQIPTINNRLMQARVWTQTTTECLCKLSKHQPGLAPRTVKYIPKS
jgi:hypothetical protein